jgi:hypothetical protein
VSVKNFWQSYPSSLEVRQASSPTAEIVAWLWSPDGPEMDMRHYDIKAHGLDASYEDVQVGLSTAYGVARTSELTLFPGAALAARADTVHGGRGQPARADRGLAGIYSLDGCVRRVELARSLDGVQKRDGGWPGFRAYVLSAAG